jgi:tetratricopeptide (TPR) repeat protein
LENDDPYLGASERLVAGDKDGAIALLRDARSRERSRGRREESAALGGYLAATLAALDRRDEALAEYSAAESEDPANPHLKLQFALFLTHVLGRAAEALPKINAALPDLAAEPSTLHAGQAVLGATLLALDRTAEAATVFRRMSSHKVLASLSAVSCDFWLVTGLIRRNLLPEESRAYLTEVWKKADNEGEQGVAHMAKTLLLGLSGPVR